MIKSFKDEDTEKVFSGYSSRRLPLDIQLAAKRKLGYLDSAQNLKDLMAPPGNRLEGLEGERKGQHSIRINDQWRICFVWKDGDACNVEIVDYH